MLEVLFPFLLSFFKCFSALFLDDLHVGLERFLIVIRKELIFLGISTGFKIFFLLLVALSDMETVESGLEVVYFLPIGSFIALCHLYYAVEYFFFGGKDLLNGSCGFCSSRFLACRLFLSFLSAVVGYGSSRCSLLLFLNSLCGIVFLRVHHLTQFKFMIRSSMAMLLHVS